MEQRARVGGETVEDGLVEADRVEFVDRDRELAQSEQSREMGVAAGLFADAFDRVDHQHGRVGLGGAAEHVADELAMAGRIDDRVAPLVPGEPHAGGVDGDGLIAFGLERVEHERPLERNAPALADGFEFGQLAVG